MPEEFSEFSNQSIPALVQDIVAIGSVLKKELPFDYLAPSWHIEDGTDNCTVGISRRVRSLWNSRPVDGASQRQMGAAVGFLTFLLPHSYVARRDAGITQPGRRW